jgi:hypothetical protein
VEFPYKDIRPGQLSEEIKSIELPGFGTVGHMGRRQNDEGKWLTVPQYIVVFFDEDAATPDQITQLREVILDHVPHPDPVTAAKQAVRDSGRAKLEALGLTEAEIAALGLR